MVLGVDKWKNLATSYLCSPVSRTRITSVKVVGGLPKNQLNGSATTWTKLHDFGFKSRICKQTAVFSSSTSPSSQLDKQPTSEHNDSKHASILSGSEIRKRFIDYYVNLGHKHLPSSSLVPDDPTVLLTIAGMLQFKPIFLGQAPRKYACVTTTQKCVRTNDIENVGVTARHHTFFEMLGNFSFGEYFKKEAIAYAWDLVTGPLGLNPEHIWVSVYHEDDESYALWKEQVGIPEHKIIRLGDKDNFWSSGPTGPCGPCTEMYYDFSPHRGGEGADLEDDSRFIEFYNLVFMQYNRDTSGKLTPLDVKCVDTGMGLERMAQILQHKSNNYETDLMFPLIAKAAELAGVEYDQLKEEQRTALKVIADHTRAVVYLISDGVIPSNIGRGYIVRRLLRRVILKGRMLGIKSSNPFTPIVAKVAINMSSACDPEVQKNAKRIESEMSREEERFVKTLDRGEALLNDLMSKASAKGGNAQISGSDAFMLYDTFGFPLEITQELAAERDILVDTEGFQAAMEGARELSRSVHDSVDLTEKSYEGELAKNFQSTEFTGYNDLVSESKVLAILKDNEEVAECHAGQKVKIVLDQTPFYAESGGQVGDHGIISSEKSNVIVKDVQKAAGGSLFIHEASVEEGHLAVGDVVKAIVDQRFRKGARVHHTTTHLLQAALKSVLGTDVSQAGSQVRPDSLRFDFNYPKPMTTEEIQKVEGLVNEWVGDGSECLTSVMSLEEAKAQGALAMFGEKYDDVVRVVDVPEVSLELCGGTHVQNTSEIRGIKIVSESGIASGVRRIEAVAGEEAIKYLSSTDDIVRDLTASLKIKREEIVPRVETLLSELRSAQNTISKLNEEIALAKTSSLVDKAVDVNGFKVVIGNVSGMDAKSLSAAAQKLQNDIGPNAAVVMATALSDKKVSLVAAFGSDVHKEKKGHAGKFISSIAQICGGRGGGKPTLAQAGGTDPSALEDALVEAKTQLQSMLS